MPARLHAVIVARSGATARAQLLRTIDALASQTRRPDAVTLVVCGDVTTARESPAVAAITDTIVEARPATSFADAVALAAPRVPEGSALWLLTHDSVPAPRALEQLAGALERSPSAAIAAPKLVRSDDAREIVSFGVTMTTFGRSVELAAHELDQGQHDGSDEALGSDIRGILVRSEVREHLTIDDALAGADEGLDLGVRARLGGGRVVLTSGAMIRVEPDGPAALPQRPTQRAYVTRLAQLHRRLAYAPAPVVPLHWLSFLPLALWRTIVHLIGKRPAEVLPEWAAAATAMVRFGAVARARGRIRAFRSAGWSSIAPLRMTGSQLRRRLDDGHGSERGAVSELRFFSGGGAWAVLGAAIVSVAAFTSLLAWQNIAGGGLLPMRDTVVGLWEDAAWGLRGLGVDVTGPADPFAAVLAVLGTLWPAGPSFSLVLLWLLALPLAVLGGWFAATRVTDRSGLRIFVGVAWALAPTFLTALIEGRPAAVIVHLLLPWLFHTAAVAHRSWGAAGAASILLVGVVAASPSLAPAMVVIWAIALIVVLAQRRLRGAVRIAWLLIPTVVMFLPLALWRLGEGDLMAIVADPGLVWQSPQATADAAGRLLLASGFPTGDLAGWAQLLDPTIAAWTPLLLVPLVLLALASAFAPRWRAGFVLLAVAAVGVATAMLVVGIAISFSQGEAVPIWPGAALSLAWVGVVGAAAVALDTLIALPRLRTIAAVVAGLALGVCAVPALTAVHTGRSVLMEGTGSTLPALIAANARGDRDLGTLVITPLGENSAATRVVWGASDTLGAQTTMLSTATEVQGTDVSALAVDLISLRDFDAAGELADLGIDYVLLDELPPASDDGAEGFRLDAVIALDQRAGFVRGGDVTGIGVLWRLEAPEADDAARSAGEDDQGVARWLMTLQLLVVLAALLLAVPTRASRRAARAISRVVGKAPEEPLTPVRRHGGDAAQDEAEAVLDAHPDAETSDDARDDEARHDEVSDDAVDPAAEDADASEPAERSGEGSSGLSTASEDETPHDAVAETVTDDEPSSDEDSRKPEEDR
ncbi:glycosyltransferase [Microbacterium sp. M28]|uniref:glycosyltransferase n=1 Tax=Microbacterium sp. M28 TaxID=2962064 RepID=UPI0021F4639A|nr:glycosyltransferase [Microbacterium sp. M28]UYO98186.1 glycosyltransferase [Microbacterium sp. M28]